MTTYNNLSRGALRDELKLRGLIIYGTVNNLRARLAADDAFGVIDGFFGTMSLEDLEIICQLRFVPLERGQGRPELRRVGYFQKLQQYNQRKRGGQIDIDEDGGWLNCGLPTPDDRLGAPDLEQGILLGTLGSVVFHQPYVDYLEAYARTHGTTEYAFTFRYWRIVQNPGIALHRLWPIRHADCRIE